MSEWKLEPGSACEVPDMVEHLVKLNGVQIGSKSTWHRAPAQKWLLVNEITGPMLPYIERRDWGRGPNRARAFRRASEVRAGGYYGKDTKNMDYLRSLHRDGWPEGAKRALELAEAIRDAVPPAEHKRRRPRWSDQGDEINMTRVYNGMLDRAWRTTRKERTQGPKVISIDVDVCYNANIDAKDLFWSGACAVAITDVLEEMGYRVELFATGATWEEDCTCLTRLVVKRADEPLNINTVAAMAAHPATFRYHILNAWCRAPWDITDGYGHAAELPEVLAEAVKAGAIEGSDVQVLGALSKEEAVKALLRAVEKLEVQQTTVEM